MKDFFGSKQFQGVLLGIGICAVAVAIFQSGVFFGYHRASFSYGGGEKYFRVFDNRGRNAPMGKFRVELQNSHGAAGKIIKIELPTFSLADHDGTEKTVLVNDKTSIRRFRDTLKPSDLITGEEVVVIGSPNAESQIIANLIRVMPELGAR